MIQLSFMIDERDAWSGTTERRSRSFAITPAEARQIVADLARQIPLAEKSEAAAKANKIADLEHQLASLRTAL